jgi:hypothetical protein
VEPPRGERFGLALRLDGRDGFRADRVAREADRRLAEQDLARRGSLLEPCRHVHRVPGDERLALLGDDLARVDADSQVDPERRDLAPQLERGAGTRRASSSCTAGTPNTAITASPMNFSTVAPCRSSVMREISK